MQRFSVIVTAKFPGFTSELEQLLLKEAFRLPASPRAPFSGLREGMLTAKSRPGFLAGSGIRHACSQTRMQTLISSEAGKPTLAVCKRSCRLNREPQRNLNSPTDWKSQTICTVSRKHGGKSPFIQIRSKDVWEVLNYYLQHHLLPGLSDVYENENGKNVIYLVFSFNFFC